MRPVIEVKRKPGLFLNLKNNSTSVVEIKRNIITRNLNIIDISRNDSSMSKCSMTEKLKKLGALFNTETAVVSLK
jgi:hypothetical protein